MPVITDSPTAGRNAIILWPNYHSASEGKPTQLQRWQTTGRSRWLLARRLIDFPRLGFGRPPLHIKVGSGCTTSRCMHPAAFSQASILLRAMSQGSSHLITRGGIEWHVEHRLHLNSTPRRSESVRMACFCCSSCGCGDARSIACIGVTTGENSALRLPLRGGPLGMAATTSAAPSITCHVTQSINPLI